MTGDTRGGAEGHDEELAQEDGHESRDGIDDETKRRKAMTRLLTVRLDKLVAKKDDECAPIFFASTSFLNAWSPAGTLYQTTSWSYPTGRFGVSTTRRYHAR